MLGYWRREEDTAEALTPDGWYRSGDMAYMDDRGYLYIVDRKDPSRDRFDGEWLRTGDMASISPDGHISITDRAKDVIKSGGEWISSVDLENELMAHPAVVEAAVIAKPDEHWTERPLACVVLRAGSRAETGDLAAFLRERVARWWVPDEFAFLDEIPKTSVGKFDKKLLRQQLAEDRLPRRRPVETGSGGRPLAEGSRRHPERTRKAADLMATTSTSSEQTTREDGGPDRTRGAGHRWDMQHGRGPATPRRSPGCTVPRSRWRSRRQLKRMISRRRLGFPRRSPGSLADDDSANITGWGGQWRLRQFEREPAMSETATRPPSGSPETEPSKGVADGAPDGAALDLLLTEAGQSTLARILPGLEAVRLAGGLARRPGTVTRRSSALVGELGKVALGCSERRPERGDRRSATLAGPRIPSSAA
jgi:hypothetical protein